MSGNVQTVHQKVENVRSRDVENAMSKVKIVSLVKLVIRLYVLRKVVPRIRSVTSDQ